MVKYAYKRTLQSLSDKLFLRIQCTWTHNLKLQVIRGCSAYRMTPILLETFSVWFRVALEIYM